MIRHGDQQLQLLAFSGIHVVQPAIFDFMPPESAFSIIDVYLKAAQSQAIYAFNHDEDLWLDVGKVDNLTKATEMFPSSSATSKS